MKARATTAGNGRLVFADLGRAIGALLVVYSHVTTLWMGWEHHLTVSAVTWFDSFTADPLGLTGQGIGEVAVPFFFLVSGFVVTPISLLEGPGPFAMKRVTRVYPLLTFAVMLSAGMLLAGQHPLPTDSSVEINPQSILANLTLINYFLVRSNSLVGVGWTLVVEVLYYLLLLCLMPLIRRCAWYAICVELTLVALVLITSRAFGANYFLVAVSVSFLPVIVIGQIIWATYSRRIPGWAGVVFVALAWSLYVVADLLHMGRLDYGYNLALAYAVVLFGIGLVVERRLRSMPWITYLSERSYSIYLLHGVVLFPALDILWKILPLWLAILLGLVVTGAVVEFSYRFVERPCHKLGSRLARRMKRRRSTEAVSSVDAPEAMTDDWPDAELTSPIPRWADRPAMPPGAASTANEHESVSEQRTPQRNGSADRWSVRGTLPSNPISQAATRSQWTEPSG